MQKTRVLFVCIHNSARSQMAEAYLNKSGGDKFEAESAGIEPGVLNPLVVEAMGLDGIDISGNETKSVYDFYKQGREFDYVITVCDKEAAERCPVFIGMTQRLHWSFPDPSKFNGTHDEKLAQVITVRDDIKEQVQRFVIEHEQ